MTNRLPEGWTGDPNVDVHEILGRVMAEAATFSSGLGIYYELHSESLLSVEGSFVSAEELSSVRPGKRAPDVTLLEPATFKPTRLIQQTPNEACFYVLLFIGENYAAEQAFFERYLTSSSLCRLRESGELSRFACVSP